MSPSSRRAWIEILLYSLTSVAKRVALLAEGVDRNIVPLEQVIYCRVALLAEGVDRNLSAVETTGAACWSPSSRRAWIEITGARCTPLASPVALLAEGVDRNLNKAAKRGTAIQSPSSRRAWIEICGSGA